jgi:hypothetical protein
MLWEIRVVAVMPQGVGKWDGMCQFCTMCPKQGVSMAAAHELISIPKRRLGKEDAAMTMPHASPAARGRRAKFTPQVIENIKELVAQGISRNEIANRLGVTVGSLQVTCSRLGISLRINSANGSRRHTGQVSPVAKFAVTMRHRGRKQTTDIPLSSAVIELLALEAMSRDLAIAELIGQVLVAAINKDMIHKILP